MHNIGMTDLLDRAVTAARNLPPEAQDEIARVVLMMATLFVRYDITVTDGAVYSRPVTGTIGEPAVRPPRPCSRP